jgi:hypothetical protein
MRVRRLVRRRPLVLVAPVVMSVDVRPAPLGLPSRLPSFGGRNRRGPQGEKVKALASQCSAGVGCGVVGAVEVDFKPDGLAG